MAGLTKEQRAAKALANAQNNESSQPLSETVQDTQKTEDVSQDEQVTGNTDEIINEENSESALPDDLLKGLPTYDDSGDESSNVDTQSIAQENQADIETSEKKNNNQDGLKSEESNSNQPLASPQTPPTVNDLKEAENQFITQNPIKKMEEKVVEPQLFSELNYKTELVIKNTNGIEQVVTKRFWEQTREAELDRLQGLELLGIAKFTDREKGEYDILPIEDDWEPEKPEKK
ncbi:hypothetical protein [Runella sp.]|uniref:hypothetical protein n=1 Tax=Runella sp. TaxID=1960881 RepID=UPI003D10922E